MGDVRYGQEVQTMVQCAVDAKTTDNYHLRVFVVAFTKKQSNNQIKKTTYAQSQQVKQIRKKMTEIVAKQVSNCDVPELIKKLLPDSIASDITKAAMPIYPVENCFVSKIKVVKKPKLDLTDWPSSTARLASRLTARASESTEVTTTSHQWPLRSKRTIVKLFLLTAFQVRFFSLVCH